MACEQLTFDKLCELEPQLRDLLVLAQQQQQQQEGFCANATWYTHLKPILLSLVGFHRQERHPVLSSSRAYDTAYRTIYDALPDCAHPGLFCPVSTLSTLPKPQETSQKS